MTTAASSAGAVALIPATCKYHHAREERPVSPFQSCLDHLEQLDGGASEDALYGPPQLSPTPVDELSPTPVDELGFGMAPSSGRYATHIHASRLGLPAMTNIF